MDNGSTDGSQFWMRGHWPDVELIENHRNLGFAEGNNVGIRRVLEDSEVGYIALLNNDCRVQTDWISTLVSALDSQTGAVQGPLVFAHDPAIVNSLGIAIEPSLWAFDAGCLEKFDPSMTTSEIFGVTAGAALFRREMVEDLLVAGSFFDPKFFAYYEDVDVAFRARLRGWRSLLVPEALVVHAGSATGHRNIAGKVYFLERNHWFYVIKNVPTTVILKRIPHFVAKRFTRTFQWLKPTSLRTFIASVRGNTMWVLWLPSLVKSRRQIRIGNRQELIRAMNLRAGSH